MSRFLGAFRAAADPPADGMGGFRGSRGFRISGTEKIANPPAADNDPLIAAYLRWIEEAAEALAAPDPELEAERAVMAAHYAEGAP